MIEVIELKVKVYLNSNINMSSSLESISKLIDKTFLKDDKLSRFHKENKFKNYCFNMLYPLEKSKIYKKGEIYTFIIRTVDKELSNHFTQNLTNEYTSEIKVLTLDKRVISKKHIDKVYSITPIIAKFEDGYWRKNNTIDVLEKRIKDNIIKKYNQFHKTEIDEDFELFTNIHIKNKKPISTQFKDIKLLGDKLELRIAENGQAQELIYFALGVGLGEVSSRGFGYINYIWI